MPSLILFFYDQVETSFCVMCAAGVNQSRETASSISQQNVQTSLSINNMTTKHFECYK